MSNRLLAGDRSRSTAIPVDLLIVTGFLGFSLWYFAQIIQGGPPHLVRSGDGANILSFVVGRLYPEVFAGDPLLSDPGNFAHYQIFTTAWTTVIGRWAGGEFALAYLILAIPCVFLHLSGFFLLFRVTGAGPLSAAFCSLAMLATVPAVTGTYWGGFTDPQPRFLFQSLLPFLLVGAWMWRDLPKRWPLLFVALGLATYVHPVSGPAVAFAVWCAVLAANLANTDWRPRTVRLIAVGFLYLAVIAPFAYLYASVGENARGSEVSTDLVLSIAENRFAEGYLDLPLLLSRGIATTWLNLRGAFAIGAVFLAVWLWRRGGENRAFVHLLGGFLVGLAIVSVLVPLLDHLVAAWLDRYPVQIDLVRNTRYFIPAVLVLFFVGINRFLADKRPRAAPALVVVLSLVWLAGSPIATGLGTGSPIGAVVDTASCVLTSRRCQDPNSTRQPYRELVSYLRQSTDPNARLFATGGDHALRYAARRTLVFSDKDGGAFAYTNHRALLQWHGLLEQNRAAADQPEPEQRLRAWLQLARQLEADYLVSEHPVDPGWPLDGARILFENDRYAVLSVAETGVVAPVAD